MIVSLLSPIVAVPKFAFNADFTFAVVAYLLVEPSDKSSVSNPPKETWDEPDITPVPPNKV